jgi:hypothetical protein
MRISGCRFAPMSMCWLERDCRALRVSTSYLGRESNAVNCWYRDQTDNSSSLPAFLPLTLTLTPACDGYLAGSQLASAPLNSGAVCACCTALVTFKAERKPAWQAWIRNGWDADAHSQIRWPGRALLTHHDSAAQRNTRLLRRQHMYGGCRAG